MEGTREKKHRISNPDKRHQDFADSASNPEPEDEETGAQKAGTKKGRRGRRAMLES
jgi:hypothetical protein